MSGSSLDGLDVAFVHLQSGAGKWGYTIEIAETIPYSAEWRARLEGAATLPLREYLVLDQEYGHYLGRQVNDFIASAGLEFQVQLVASHGHTVFHDPVAGMTAQLGSGAAIAAETGLQTVSDLRTLDVALGGQGAPIVPIGERWLFPGYAYFLNLGGIANISAAAAGIAFDVCPANRVLNLLATRAGKAYDEEGSLASSGEVVPSVLEALNGLVYYRQPPPKSLDNSFGTQTVLGLLGSCSPEDGLRTYVEHIAVQVAAALPGRSGGEMLVTGGGAHNVFLIDRLRERLASLGVTVVVPDAAVVDFKEALVMALFGVLRLRQEENTLATVTGASRDSIGGALWNGQEG